MAKLAHQNAPSSDPASRGSYSFLPPGAHGMHYDLLAAPVDGQLLWAGEATNRHHPTTAAGALDSGNREALRLRAVYGCAHRDPEARRLLARRAQRLAAAPPLPPAALVRRAVAQGGA